ncbi:MAG: NifU family protein [Deferribacteraceae bacterium]|jgi:Fe-S cluster biogenesis protein NfuA|nr:NifU family protein [Deferribacteraceae bacterium]
MALKAQVEEVLNQVRPMLQQDGGDVQLVNVTDEGVVQVKLTGACGSCQYATMTLKNGIENRLKELVPAVKEVVAV